VAHLATPYTQEIGIAVRPNVTRVESRVIGPIRADDLQDR
jgi:hypothetical protein